MIGGPSPQQAARVRTMDITLTILAMCFLVGFIFCESRRVLRQEYKHYAKYIAGAFAIFLASAFTIKLVFS